jgi:MFS superfamily sulfate permease-like transporter
MKYELKQNFIAGLLVSFIALPLCIAISGASEFPLLAGVITAIIGGVLVSQINGSQIAITGPAAGMIVVIFDSVEKLGNGNNFEGYKYTLAAIFFASLMQIATSFTKLPNLMRKFPEYIIRGMMIAIGTIVFLKQIFILCGHKAPHVSTLEFFIHIPKEALLGAHLESLALGIFAIFFILIWKKYLEKKYYIYKIIPVYLITIFIGAILAKIFDIQNNQHFLMKAFSDPLDSSFITISKNISDTINFPNFSLISSLKFWIATFTIYAVATLETILSAIAIDKIDPQKRHTNLAKDIRGIGIGNAICGSLGALPMIAEIVRSSASVSYGATNKFANFFHGICLLLMVTLLQKYLNFIPLSILAGMLIIIALTMINIKNLIEHFHENKKEFCVILAIVFFTLYIDLLVGIAIGFCLHLISNKKWQK